MTDLRMFVLQAGLTGLFVGLACIGAWSFYTMLRRGETGKALRQLAVVVSAALAGMYWACRTVSG